MGWRLVQDQKVLAMTCASGPALCIQPKAHAGEQLIQHLQRLLWMY